jgi:hypothetical protein
MAAIGVPVLQGLADDSDKNVRDAVKKALKRIVD